MHLPSLTDDELHRIARDSSDPLVLELMRRMDRNGDERDAAVSDDEGKDSLIEELTDQCAALEQRIEKLEQQLRESKTPTTNN